MPAAAADAAPKRRAERKLRLFELVFNTWNPLVSNASLIGHRDVAPKRSNRMLGIARWANPFETKGTKTIIRQLLQKWRYLLATRNSRTLTVLIRINPECRIKETGRAPAHEAARRNQNGRRGQPKDCQQS
jgi:hypothetical protein